MCIDFKLKFDSQNTHNKQQKPLRSSTQWLFSYLIGLSSLFLFSCSSGQTNTYYYPIEPEHINTQFMELKLKGSIALTSSNFNSIPVTELSGIAWSKDDQILFAVSDEGYLYHFTVIVKNKQLHDLDVLFAAKLVDPNGIPLKGKFRDSEGLALLNSNNGKQGDTELLISFENKPRIAKFSTRGQKIHKIKLPKKISKRNQFIDKNKALESIAYHPKFGVITAAEFPIKNRPSHIQTLFSSSGAEWNFGRSKAEKSAITGLEVLANGDVLVLERAYKNPFTPVIIYLRRLILDQCDSKQKCRTETVARFDASDGWSIDNFEGLAHFKDNQYLMVSDDNNSPLQQTILVLFEVIESQKNNQH